MRAGFVGLGVMGRPMARRILGAGIPLTVTSRSAAAVAELADAGARPAKTPRDVAAASDVAIVMVPATSDLQAVLDGPEGILAGAHPDLVIVAMGTHDPAAMPRIAERAAADGAAFLDAPVSGGDVGAREGTLSIMVGGDAEAFRRAEPVLQAMGSRVVHLGPSGAGQVAKACNQLLVGSTIQAVAEALTLARAAGLDPAVVRDVLGGGFAASRVLELHGRRMLDGEYTPGGRVALHHKDAHIILALAQELGVDLPGFAPVADAFDHLVAAGRGELDHSALITLLEPARRDDPARSAGPDSHAVPVRQMRLVVTADDYDEALVFYRDVLGLPQLAAFTAEGGYVTILDAGRATLELTDPVHAAYIDRVEVGERVAGHLRVAFEVDDSARVTRELESAGARVIAEPVRTPWDSLNARLEAPAGLQLTLFMELGAGDIGPG